MRLVEHCARGDGPRWKRILLIDKDGGRAFVPLFMHSEPEEAAFMFAVHDGASMVTHEGHTYVDASWVIKERPDIADELSEILEREMNRDETI